MYIICIIGIFLEEGFLIINTTCRRSQTGTGYRNGDRCISPLFLCISVCTLQRCCGMDTLMLLYRQRLLDQMFSRQKCIFDQLYTCLCVHTYCIEYAFGHSHISVASCMQTIYFFVFLCVCLEACKVTRDLTFTEVHSSSCSFSKPAFNIIIIDFSQIVCLCSSALIDC